MFIKAEDSETKKGLNIEATGEILGGAALALQRCFVLEVSQGGAAVGSLGCKSHSDRSEPRRGSVCLLKS